MTMLEQLKTAHAKVKSGADFPKYIQEIHQLGIIKYQTYVTDGHTAFTGKDSNELLSAPKYSPLTIATSSDKIQFQKDLKEHQQGKTDYQTFCQISAQLGVEKWVVDMEKMTCTYYDKNNNEMLVETIPSVK